MLHQYELRVYPTILHNSLRTSVYMNILISKHSFKLCLLTRYSADVNHNFSFSVFSDEIAGPDGPLRRRPV